MRFYTFLIFIFCLTKFVYSKDFQLKNILHLDPAFTHHVLVVEKSTHRLLIYENDNTKPKLLKIFKIATGAKTGDKKIQGDKKTPEGIYRFHNFYSEENLLKKYGKLGSIYGIGAFTLNYPNIIDRRLRKTGGGIWLHSTDDDMRVDKGLDSRGCVVAKEVHLKEISQYIDLKNTPIIIVEDLEYLTRESWKSKREKLKEFIDEWAGAWRSKNFDQYISKYSKSFYNAKKGSFNKYKNYKRAVFKRDDTPQIDFNNISALQFDNYAVVTMKQDYRSSIIQDVGKKILYLEKDKNYNWKIISENWYSLKEEDSLAFTPSMRYFQSNVDSTKEKMADSSQ